MASMQPSINAGFVSANNNLESVAISPTFKFLLGYNSTSALMKRFDGSAYAAVVASRVPAGPGDWTPDGLFYVGSSGSGNIQLRAMEDAGPATAVLHTLTLIAVRSIKYVKDDIFVGLPATNTADITFFRVNRVSNQLESIGSLNVGSIAGWDVSDNGVMIVLTGSTSTRSLSRIDIVSGAPVVTATLSNALTNCNFLAISADGTRWVAGTTSGTAAVGLVNPLQIVPYTFSPQPQMVAFVFNDEYIQTLSGTTTVTQRFYKINSDMSQIDLSNDVTFPGMSASNPSGGQSTRRHFARRTNADGETLTAWKITATTSQSPAFYFRMAIPDAPPSTLVALAPMADAVFNTKPGDLRLALGDLAPMAWAYADTVENDQFDPFVLVPMADAFMRAGILGNSRFVALAPMADAIAEAPPTPSYFIAKAKPPYALFQAHPPVPVEFVAVAPKHTAYFQDAQNVAVEVYTVVPPPSAHFQQRSRRRRVLFAVNEF